MAKGYDASWPPTGSAGIGALAGVPPPEADDWNHPMVARLERHWQDSTGRDHVIACRSGRVALLFALTSLDLGPGDEVICPADSVELRHYLERSGLIAVPADLDPQTLQLSPEAVEQAITVNTQAVVVVDQHGTTADYRALRSVADRHGLALIEDGSQSVGAAYEGRPVGSFGHISLCSLVGEDVRSSLGTGGLFATDCPDLAATARRLLIVNNEAGMASGGEGATGWTCQLSDLDAAVADSQLRRRQDRIADRCMNGSHLRARLASIAGIWTPDVLRSASHVYTSLPLVVVPDELGLPESSAVTLRDTVVDCLTAEGLWVDRWQPQSLGAALGSGSGMGGRPGEFPVAEALLANGIMLGPQRSPFDPPHTIETMDRIAECFEKVFVENADRLRSLTLQRSELNAMS